jgi:hypothetical protein
MLPGAGYDTWLHPAGTLGEIRKMQFAKKIVLHSLAGYRPELDGLVERFKMAGVKYVGVVGVDACRIEEIIDELCVGDGAAPFDMLTASHPGESLQDAVRFAESLQLDLAGTVQVVRF